ncbi:Het-C-domain-containing protein [Punctularia strigosozonata HHB-11173 SS5]|uniref:Het-C-domain-containing protein n=1 Tax=Punctularia strigosozonata (strain HHB-11173) TaxID=741275 RepID=UPI0004416695|nr:Het-C-domain-containing protein [Punctularia strigosozonata HHB-11173 SS5]EIN14403.1 Het-C-domain-containing protein [Punctularia strigosozonata HHB-11173 SS5]
MASSLLTVLILATVLGVLSEGALAFGAGDIPDFAFLNDKAFRHGDIENVLTNLAKAAGAASGGGGILQLAQSVLNAASGGATFTSGDVKKVYFGNWLRDYSQAMDIAGLSKLSADTLVLVVAVLGFMSFGFATGEFEVTADRLGVYLPVEHIDNPKGYAEKEEDARQFHPKLRPPVDPRELEIDERTGMKNYMATENRGWDTSTAHIRRTFKQCIERGRRAHGRDGADLWEAYRLLGTGLHTLEDLLAHSNWCEIALRRMGHEQVFCHVGDNVIIQTPNGPAPPLVTGTFGSADFFHSVLGEATDHLSQTSMTDLSQKMNDAKLGNQNEKFDALKSILGKLGGGDSDGKVSEAEDINQKSKAYSFDPGDIAPPEVQQQLWEILKWRDSIFKTVLEKIEMIPGLSELIDNLTDALNAYVYTLLTPYLEPIVTQVTAVLGEGSKAVIDSDDQYETFDNPDASDPSHSLLSKDHFALILNEPAGRVAMVVVEHTVNLIVKAWFDGGQDEDHVIDEILEAFHHPYYNIGNSRIQHDMFQTFDKWFGSLGSEDSAKVLDGLTKDGVRNGRNKRLSSEEEEIAAGGSGYYGPDGQARMKSGSHRGHSFDADEEANLTRQGHGSSYSRHDDDNQIPQSQTTYQQESDYPQRGYNPSYTQTETSSFANSYGSSARYPQRDDQGREEYADVDNDGATGTEYRNTTFGRENPDNYGYTSGPAPRREQLLYESRLDEYRSSHRPRSDESYGEPPAIPAYEEVSERHEYEGREDASGFYGSATLGDQANEDGVDQQARYGEEARLSHHSGRSHRHHPDSGMSRCVEGYGDNQERSALDQTGYGGREFAGEGYNPAYEVPRRDDDYQRTEGYGDGETFGAERLTIDDEGGDYHHPFRMDRRHHGQDGFGNENDEKYGGGYGRDY